MALAGNDHDGNGGRAGEPTPVTPAPSEANVQGEVGGADGGEELDEPRQTAAAFVTAVAWGEHLRVWDLFTAEARSLVLRVAVTRGMDERLAARLRDGTATNAERDTFLGDLVNGLRADLKGTDLDSLQFEPDADTGQPDPNRTRIMLMVPVVNPLLGAPLPVASIELVRDRGQWRVEHLFPRIQR